MNATVLVTESPGAKAAGDTRHDLLLHIAFIIAAAILVYANSWWNGFAYDDDWIILRNTRVHQLRDLGLIFGTPYWPVFGEVLGLYRPIPIFGYALQWALADGAPWVFHVGNTVLHAGVSVLVFLLVSLFARRTAAAVGALIFAVHPVHTEAVANVIGQAELWSSIGVLGACLIYASRPALEVSWPRRVGIAALYLFAILSKESAITMPALLIVLDAAQSRISWTRQDLRRYLAELWMPMFLLASVAVFYLGIRVDVLGSIGGDDAAPGLPFLREEHRMLNAFRAWPEYVRLLFVPADLSVDYSPAVILPVETLNPMTLLGLGILLLTVTLGILTPLHAKPGLPAAWFFITIFTVSNLLFPVGIVVAERTLYLPSVAVAFIVAYAWDALAPGVTARHRRVLYAVAATIAVLFGVRTFTRNPDWKNTITAVQSLVRDHPESYRSAWVMADRLWLRGDLAQADFYWNAAVLLWPRDSQLLMEYGNFQIALRNWAKALEYLHRARAMHPWLARTNELIAYSYVYAGKPHEALAFADSAFRADGQKAMLYAITAKASEDIGEVDRSIAAWRATVRQKSGGLWVHWGMLARALARGGYRAEASAAIDTALVVGTDSIARRTLVELRAAVDRGCYANNQDGCVDVLDGWMIGVPQTQVSVRDVASQNAMDRAVSVPDGAVP